MDLPLSLACAFDRFLGQSLHPSQGDLGLLAECALGLSHPGRGNGAAGGRMMHRLSICITCAALAIAPLPGFAQPDPKAGIGYPSVAAALSALRAKPGVKFSTQDGWTIANDTDGAIWSFTPANHYANPAVGRRAIREQGGSFSVETRILCQAQKSACDRLQKDYVLLDQRMNEAIRAEQGKKK